MTLQEEKFYQSCPNCRARYVYLKKNVGPDAHFPCQNCGQLMDAEGKTDYLYIKDGNEELSSTKRFLNGVFLTILFIFIFLLLFLMTLEFPRPSWPGFGIH